MKTDEIIKNLLSELPRCDHRSVAPNEPGRCPSPATRTFVVLKPIGPNGEYTFTMGGSSNRPSRTGDLGLAGVGANGAIREEWDRCDDHGLPSGVEAGHVLDKPIAETVRAVLRGDDS
jgi:hypothetical protein